MTFDVSQFENADEGSFNVRLQNGEEMLIDGKPVIITMHGLGSREQVRAEYKLTRETNASTVATVNGRAPRDAEEQSFQRTAEYLAACTKSIDNWPAEGGARAIYLNRQLGYITEQANVFLRNAANFMRSSTASSPSSSGNPPT